MALSEETKRGIAANLATAMHGTVNIIEKVDPKDSRTNSQDLLTKQTAIQTIVLISLAQILLEQTEVNRIIAPH